MAHGQLKVSYIHVPTPNAGGRRINRGVGESMEQWLARLTKSGTIYSPQNTDDQMCLARAVVVAKAREGMHRQAFYKMKQPNSVMQRKEALSLCQAAQIDPQQPCGLAEVQKLQEALPAYRLCIFTGKEGNTECVFKGPFGPGRKNICLLLYQEHFYAILYPEQAFGFHFMCEKMCDIFSS
jgi:hypothetical protein